MSKIIEFKSREDIKRLEDAEQMEQDHLNKVLLEEVKAICNSIDNNDIPLYVTYDGINTISIEPDSLLDMAKELESIQNTYDLEADQVDERIEGNFIDSAFSYIVKIHVSDVIHRNYTQIKTDIMDMIENYSNSIFHIYDLNRDAENGLTIINVVDDIATMTTKEAEEILFDGMEEYKMMPNIHRDHLAVMDKVIIEDAIESTKSSIDSIKADKLLTYKIKEELIERSQRWINELMQYTKAKTNKIYYSLYNVDFSRVCVIDEEGNIFKILN